MSVTNEMLYEEMLKIEALLRETEQTLEEVRVEMQRTLWDAEMGRQKIDRARAAYEAQVARRRAAAKVSS